MKLLTSRLMLHNQINTGFLCCLKPVLIERTMPDIIEDRISPFEWNNFCNEIDATLTPIWEYKRGARIYFLLFWFYSASLLIIGAAAVIWSDLECINFSIEESDSTYIIIGKWARRGVLHFKTSFMAFQHTLGST